MDQGQPISRRTVLRVGVGLLGMGALGALLSACGGATATATTAASTGGAVGAASAAPSAGGTRVAGNSSAPTSAGPGSTVAALGTPVGVSNLKPPKNPNATKISWWFGLGGALGKAIETLTEQYNDSQNEIYVEAIYQGNYDDT